MQFYDGDAISTSTNSSSTTSIKAEVTGDLVSTTDTSSDSVGDSLRDHITNTITNTNINNDNNNFNNNSNDGIIVKKANLGIPMHPVPEIEIAELTKIVENANRYLQIAFAEDLYLYCQANNINFAELRDSLNTKWNVNILEPRDGIGGHCLPKDTKMFLNSSKSIRSKIIEAAIQVDSEYRKYRGKSKEASQPDADGADTGAETELEISPRLSGSNI
jgi:hypothetical protein